ncbi:GNAT family N-acetyltransferase [Candidatus Thiosymbion oneisti]|uniref:GNAT family N-acetyltransferase n=1 Tax=Candidatus Thiosymbion oneisti TaxID=589554 RepID=UPI000B7EF9B7|nr:GNAT family N-acetyltransferase [Candidatus Thiosymbion oneisti]
MVDIKEIGGHKNLLEQVKSLWGKNRSTLGPFPMGAFEDYAEKGTILVAIDSRDPEKCLGYLLYREVPSYNRIALTHLCVDPKVRRAGVAERLVDALKHRTASRRGIGLWCRRDFPATKMWPRLGFVYRKERQGRGIGITILNYWWFDHGHSDLLSVIDRRENDVRPTVALDASVFFNFIDESREGDDEIAAMSADWILPEVRYTVTTELLNEIARCENPEEREHQRNLAQRMFSELPTDDSEFSRIMDVLEKNLGRALNQSIASDRRQLARAASGAADFFVTQDQELLQIALDQTEVLGLSVLTPAEFVTRIDSLLREVEYRPALLRGSYYTSDPGTEIKIQEMQEYFLNYEAGEKRQQFQSTLTNLLANPQNSFVRVIRNQQGQPIALLGLDLQDLSNAFLRICRVSKGRDAKTLACQLLEEAILESVRRSTNLCVIDDDNFSPAVAEMYNDMGFALVGDKSLKLKLSIQGIVEKQMISDLIREATVSIKGTIPGLTDFVQQLSDIFSRESDDLTISQAEKLLRPLKVKDISLPCYIVPIESVWAAQLFDDDLAVQGIFKAKPELIFRKTNAYYRSARQCGINAPGRILWYVKQSHQYQGAKAIRGCSYLDEVIIDSAKSLFSRFRRFGVYSWRDVQNLTKNRNDDQVMALLFSYSERFNNPISFDEAQIILERWGMQRNQFQSPLRIPSGAFNDIYHRGAL